MSDSGPRQHKRERHTTPTDSNPWVCNAPGRNRYIAMRVLKQLFRDPMSVLPAFGILLGSAILIGLEFLML